MRDTVRFTLNGKPVEIRAPDPTRTVLEWLREDRRLTGTKEGCAEGDCGACTVMAVDPQGKVRAFNSCIQFLPMIDGCALTTVEGLGGNDPVQKELVREHGSQCGFCTPGFVMALHAHHARGGSTEPQAITDAIAGNLCRCTGYGPIIRAGQTACATPAPKAEPARQNAEPLGYETNDGRGIRRFFAPTSVDEMARLYETYPDAVILGGATDVGLWVTKQGRRIETIISVMRVTELQEEWPVLDGVGIGAAMTYADAFEVLFGLHPSLRDYLRRLGATQVRDSGTVVGNIANGSPIGDMPPILIALDAQIQLRKGASTRTIPLEDFYIEYGKQDRAPGEFITHIIVGQPNGWELIAAEKISKRFEQDISAVSAGFFVSLGNSGVEGARLAYGGMAGVPKRARNAEAALMGQPWNEASVQAAMAALAKDFQPLTDWRASADYRLAAAQNLLLRFYLENQTRGALEAQRVTSLVGVEHG
ncbi:MAG TPA: xanthine dehydrogenase small subunit [Hyphomonadaceae bacterium]|nr:xanthine dehydrogenase small subunit [Hyphomonadaceae bacterium]